MKKTACVLMLIISSTISLFSQSLSDSLVAYYSFDSFSGSNIPDLTGHGYDGYPNKTVELVPGIIGNALKLDGTNWLNILNGSLFLKGECNITFCTWVNPRHTDDLRHIVWASGDSYRDGLDPISVQIRRDYLKDVGFQDAARRLGIKHDITNFNLKTPQNEWTFIAVTLELKNGKTTMNIFINTKLVETVDYIVDNDYKRTSEKIMCMDYDIPMASYIGCIERDQRWIGLIDDLRFYKRVLSTQEIEKLYNICDSTNFSILNFKSDDVYLNGNSSINNYHIRLTSNKNNEKGSSWYKEKMPVAKGFTTDFQFKISVPNENPKLDGSLLGADGFAFVLQNESPNALGIDNAGLGYSGIKNCLAIEFDMFKNSSSNLPNLNDPNGNHIAVQCGTKYSTSSIHNSQNTIAIEPNIIEINPNGSIYNVHIEYNIEPDILKIFFGQTIDLKNPALELKNFNISKLINLDSGRAYYGFTASTAEASSEIHEILTWSVCPKIFKCTDYKPEIKLNGQNSFCEGDSVILSISYEYESCNWNNGDTSHSIIIKKAGIYTVNTLKDGCPGTNNIEIFVLPKPQTKITILGNVNPCDGDSVHLSVPNNLFSYKWYDAEKNILLKTNTNNLTVTTSGKYAISVTDTNGCHGTDTIQVNILKPPQIAAIDSCYKINGLVYIPNIDLNGIQSVSEIPSLSENVIVNIENFIPYPDTVCFNAILIDIRKDGKFTLNIKDSLCPEISQDFNIPGFTVSLPNYEFTNNLPLYEETIEPNKDHCFYVKIYNYGKFPQSISNVSLKNDIQFTIANNNISILQPGQLDSIKICFKTKEVGEFTDTLIITGKCGNRNIIAMKISTSQCDRSFFEYSEFNTVNELNFSGKAARLDNKWIRLTSTEYYTAGAMWRKNLIPVGNGFTTSFQFRFSEGANNAANESSIPGADGIAFVIQNHEPYTSGVDGGGIGYHRIPNSLAVEFDSFANDEKQMENFNDPNGNHIAVQSKGTESNSSYHEQPATLGLASNIMPIKSDGTIYFVTIDYKVVPNTLRIFLDTIKDSPAPSVLEVSNLDLHSLLSLEQGVRAYVGFTAATGSAWENHDILSWYFCPVPSEYKPVEETDNFKVNKGLSCFPNPFTNQTTIEFSVERPAKVRLQIFDILGREVEELASEYLYQGNYRFVWDAGKHQKGIYYCRLLNGKSVESVQLNLTK